jgi:hypothetical protein
MKPLDNIYGNKSQTYRPKGKTYKDARLGELAQSIAVEHALEREVACGREPTGEKRVEGEDMQASNPCGPLDVDPILDTSRRFSQSFVR